MQTAHHTSLHMHPYAVKHGEIIVLHRRRFSRIKRFSV